MKTDIVSGNRNRATGPVEVRNRLALVAAICDSCLLKRAQDCATSFAVEEHRGHECLTCVCANIVRKGVEGRLEADHVVIAVWSNDDIKGKRSVLRQDHVVDDSDDANAIDCSPGKLSALRVANSAHGSTLVN